jgi:uncharacterized protein YyaL (SSP411 family)
MPAFGELLQNIAAYYRNKRDEVRSQSERLLEVFTKLEPAPADPDSQLERSPLVTARNTFEETFDSDYGGFGSAPKFPHPTTIDHLLRHWRASANGAEPDVAALFMATLTLTRMADGGLFDHVGGGFCRYSVDRYWQIPHFEKMLYDNGPLLALYSQAALATGDANFADVANATADWMLADSEGQEGIYYLWRPEQVRELIGDDYEVFARRFGLNRDANFEGQWHLTVRESIREVAAATSRDEKDVVAVIENAKKGLLLERLKRVAPGRDEKQLTSWNALAIRGLAIAGRALQRPDLIDAAARATEFLRNTLLVDGRLLASYKDGEARFPAYLDDHAFLLDALLELLQARWDTAHLEFAIQIADLMLEHFEDRNVGAFFFTADDHETLIHRPKPLADEAVPSGNGIAAFVLQRLGFLLGDTRYLDAAERSLHASWRAINEYPHGHVSLLTALEEYLDHPEIIVIRGDSGEIARWLDAAARLYAPRRLVFAISSDTVDLPGALADRSAIDGETVAYRCLGTHCEMPVTTWEALAAQLSETTAGGVEAET